MLCCCDCVNEEEDVVSVFFTVVADFDLFLLCSNEGEGISSVCSCCGIKKASTATGSTSGRRVDASSNIRTRVVIWRIVLKVVAVPLPCFMV